ncbi:hypothetical protein JCM6882_007888 [Rhodosporidiobolus microsporus]
MAHPGSGSWWPPPPTAMPAPTSELDPPSSRFPPPAYPPPLYPPQHHSTYPPPQHHHQPYYAPQNPSPTFSSSPPFPPPAVNPHPYPPTPPLQPLPPSPSLPTVQHGVHSAVESARWLQTVFPSPSSRALSTLQHHPPPPPELAFYPPYRASTADTSTLSYGGGSTSGAASGSSVPSGLAAYSTSEEEHDGPTDIKPFIHKLFAMLSDPASYSDVITWSSDGTAFFVAHNDRFLNEVLPRQFQHNNITSFTRQLNVYDFNRMNVAQLRSALKNPAVTASEYSGWSHRLFQRGDSSNLHLLTPRQSRARLMRKLEKQYGKRKMEEG